jgi:hypothetical protein
LRERKEILNNTEVSEANKVLRTTTSNIKLGALIDGYTLNQRNPCRATEICRIFNKITTKELLKMTFRLKENKTCWDNEYHLPRALIRPTSFYRKEQSGQVQEKLGNLADSTLFALI